MRIARWQTTTSSHRSEGFVIGDRVHVFPDGATVATVLEGGLDAARRLLDRVGDDPGTPLADVRLLAPLDPPTIRDFSVFEEHVEGMTMDAGGSAHIPDVWYRLPLFYFTNPYAVIGPGDVVIPPVTERLDVELEVAAVVGGVPGSTGEHLPPDAAARHIFGYVILNDWSARDIQRVEMAGMLGPAKGKDFATSVGPWIVTADELADRIDAEGMLRLGVELWINGELVGTDDLSHMAWTFPELVSHASRDTRVAPGDLIGSGTTGRGCLGELWGRAGGRLEPPALVAGDVAEIRVERLGRLANTIGTPRPALPFPPARRRVDGATRAE